MTTKLSKLAEVPQSRTIYVQRERSSLIFHIGVGKMIDRLLLPRIMDSKPPLISILNSKLFFNCHRSIALRGEEEFGENRLCGKRRRRGRNHLINKIQTPSLIRRESDKTDGRKVLLALIENLSSSIASSRSKLGWRDFEISQ